ncbi:hypothetical protein L6R46_08810 [Myxococcota bacterium]|nr:hypothetical protein [Myxococcota bacterium]
MPGPSFDLDWELGLFKAVRALWRAVAPSPAPLFDPARAATLAAHGPALRVLGQMIAGEAVRLQPARSEGGVRGRDLLIPAWIEVCADPTLNREIMALRVVVAAELRRLRLVAPEEELENLFVSVSAAQDAANGLSARLPRFAEAWAEACALVLRGRPDPASLSGRARLIEELRQSALRGETSWRTPERLALLRATPERGAASPPVPLWGRLHPASPEDALGGDESPDKLDQQPPSAEATEREAGAIEELKLVQLKPNEGLELPTHVFEKVETAEGFNGSMRQLDGEDELNDHMEALDEVDLSHLVRGGPRASSVLKAEIGLDVEVPDISRVSPGERAVLYDEWDHRAKNYRKGWCQVYPTQAPRGDQRWAMEALSRHRRLVERLYQDLAKQRAALAPAPRQADGEEIDLDAVVEAWSELRARRSPPDRLYIRARRQRRDVATTVLLDLSLSTDSWVQDRRVLDVSREAVLVLGEVAERLGDSLQVLAFASQTRNQIRVWEVRGWSEPWSVGRGRLGALCPQGYTRIGPAVRHAVAGLRKRDARERLLLIVSDGKPTDHDRYEGRYGVADVRQALREAKRDGVHVHALAIDAVARDYLPSMLGPGGWTILPRPDRLPEAITQIYGRLV